MKTAIALPIVIAFGAGVALSAIQHDARLEAARAKHREALRIAEAYQQMCAPESIVFGAALQAAAHQEPRK